MSDNTRGEKKEREYYKTLERVQVDSKGRPIKLEVLKEEWHSFLTQKKALYFFKKESSRQAKGKALAKAWLKRDVISTEQLLKAISEMIGIQEEFKVNGVKKERTLEKGRGSTPSEPPELEEEEEEEESGMQVAKLLVDGSIRSK